MYLYHNFFGTVSVLVIVARQSIKNRVGTPCTNFKLQKYPGFITQTLKMVKVCKMKVQIMKTDQASKKGHMKLLHGF